MVTLRLALCAFLILSGQAFAAIAYVNSADLGNNGGSGSLSTSYTVGSGSNRLLVLTIVGDVQGGNDDISTVTYNGVALTLGKKGVPTQGPASERYIYVYYLLNPASGSNTVVVSSSNNHYLIVVAADYSGVAQSGQPDATGTAEINAASSITTAITIVSPNSWAVSGYSYTNSSGETLSSGSNATIRVAGATFNLPTYADSAGPLAAGSQNLVISDSPSSCVMVSAAVSFAPAPCVPGSLATLGVGAC